MMTMRHHALLLQVVDALVKLSDKAPQHEIDGPDNIWILKPGGKSRGRGIHCFNNLRKLRTQVRHRPQSWQHLL
jgi:tubulin monoglycylase TTLL3/8